MDITYTPTENNIEVPTGYQPRYSQKLAWTPTRKASQNETTSQDEPQGGYLWDGTEQYKAQDTTPELDFNAKTNLAQRQVASKYLQSKLNLTKEQAAGLIGVWQAESGFKLDAENQAEKQGKNTAVKSNQYGIGIGQWTGSRHDDFVNYVKTHGGKSDLKTQLDFAIDEIQNKYSDYLNNLRKATNVKDATAYTYLQYTGGTHTGIKDTADLYRRVSRMEEAYAKKHKELYGTSGSGNLDRRVKYAEESIFAKFGAKLNF